VLRFLVEAREVVEIGLDARQVLDSGDRQYGQPWPPRIGLSRRTTA